MNLDILDNLTEAQTKVLNKLEIGVQIRHLTGNSYRLHDPKRRYEQASINPCTFEILNSAGILKVVDRGQYFETYALDEAQYGVSETGQASNWIKKRNSNYKPVPLGVVSPEAWRQWNQ